MNRNDFLRMMGSSGPADRQMVAEVDELIGIFPYFHSAYMMLLKGLHNITDVKYENRLRNCALHIADREVLYYYLKKEDDHGDKSITEIQIVQAAPDNDMPGDSQQTVIESGMNSQEMIREIEKEYENTPDDETARDISVIISTGTGYTDSDATVLIIDRETGEVEERINYMDPGFSVADESDLLELDTEENLYDGSAADNPSPDDKPQERKLQSDLIDIFIETNPRIEPSREKTDTPVEDLSEHYVEERGSFITETLAGIYIKQGYYSKALDIYEKLSLKFPEKSSYFASQIEKVKELIKK